jgi:alanine-synthesizing transaminase
VKPGLIPKFDDQAFALELLEKRHVLVTPGHGFNVPYRDAFRITLLPDAETMKRVLAILDEAAEEYAARG